MRFRRFGRPLHPYPTSSKETHLQFLHTTVPLCQPRGRITAHTQARFLQLWCNDYRCGLANRRNQPF